MGDSPIEDHPALERGLADANAGRVHPGVLRSDVGTPADPLPDDIPEGDSGDVTDEGDDEPVFDPYESPDPAHILSGKAPEPIVLPTYRLEQLEGNDV